MNIRTERRGLGRGLGELFQRTEPQPLPASENGQSESAPLAPVRLVPTSPSCPWKRSPPTLGSPEPSSMRRR